MITRERLIQVIHEELGRQSADSRHDGLYLYNEYGHEIGVDGVLRLDQLAEAILNFYAADQNA